MTSISSCIRINTKAHYRGKMKQHFHSSLSLQLLNSMNPSCLEDSSSAEAARSFHSDEAYTATVEVIALLQLTPVLVDVEKDTFNISPEAIRKAITPKTKAIVPVHLFGQAANMEAIMQIAKKHNLYVIEDNAQGIGADYTYSDGTKAKTGTIGDIASTSFFPSISCPTSQ